MLDKMDVVKPKRKRRKGPLPLEAYEHRIYYTTEHFCLLRSVKDKWGGRRIALIERKPNCLPPSRIDPRLKSIVRIIKLREVYRFHSFQGSWLLKRSHEEFVILIDKLERLWPCQFMAKELNGVKLTSPPPHPNIKEKSIENRND